MALLTQAQAAQHFGVSDRSLRTWVKAGCPQVGEGRKAVYDPVAVEAWLLRSGRRPGVRPAPPAPGPPAPTPAAPVDQAPPAAVAELAELSELPAPTTDQERALAVEARGRLWSAAAAAARSLESRVVSGRLEPTPQQAEAIARAGRMLTEAVRGDGSAGDPRSHRELLAEALAAWLAQWGEQGLQAVLGEARALAQGIGT